MMAFLSYLTSDAIWFSTFQCFLGILTIWAFSKMNVFTEKSPVSGVHRAENSRSVLSQSAPFVLTVVVSVIASISSFPKDGKVFFYLLNVIEVLYLTMWNGWSTNKLIGFVGRFEHRNFNPHR